MSEVIDQVRRLKARAMDARDADDPERAVRLLQQGEKMLRSTLDDLRARRGREPPGRQEIDVANQLVHVLGSIGGTLRREQDYERAIDAYDAGRQLEAPEAGYGIVNSYTLVQGLVSRVFLEPGSVRESAPPVKDCQVHAELRAAQAEIARQLHGARSNDEYAAADLTTVLLLLNDPDWETSLDDFLASRPEPYAVDVTRELLADLHDRVATAASAPGDLAERLAIASERLAAPS